MIHEGINWVNSLFAYFVYVVHLGKTQAYVLFSDIDVFIYLKQINI